MYNKKKSEFAHENAIRRYTIGTTTLYYAFSSYNLRRSENNYE